MVIGVPDLGVLEGVLLPPFMRAGAVIVQLRRCGKSEKVFNHALFAATGVKGFGRLDTRIGVGALRSSASL